MNAKHMKETEDNISANLVRDKDFKIDLLNSQLATRKMKEIASEHYKRLAVDLYGLDVLAQNNRTTKYRPK